MTVTYLKEIDFKKDLDGCGRLARPKYSKDIIFRSCLYKEV